MPTDLRNCAEINETGLSYCIGELPYPHPMELARRLNRLIGLLQENGFFDRAYDPDGYYSATTGTDLHGNIRVVVHLPLEDMDLLEETARECGLLVTNSLGKDTFPMQNPNIFFFELDPEFIDIDDANASHPLQ